MSAGNVRALLARHGLAPRRDLGQNFLTDAPLADKLARRAGVQPGEGVLEIGTGLGILTRALADAGARVVSVEVDAGLVRLLRAEHALPAGVELVHGDAMALDLASLCDRVGVTRAVANLPYASASPLLRRLLDLRGRLVGWSVMLQRELADRLVAVPGTKEYGSLTLLHALCAEARRELDVHPRCFVPAPRVGSSFVTLRSRADAPDDAALAAIESLARAAFAHRRKTLVGALRSARHPAAADPARLEAVLAQLSIDPRARPETLDPATWARLARAL